MRISQVAVYFPCFFPSCVVRVFVVCRSVIGLVSIVITVVVLATTGGLLIGTNDTSPCNII